MALALLPRMRSLGAIFVRPTLRACSSVGHEPRISGDVWLHGGGSIRVGDRVHLDGSRAPIELHAAPGAEIVLGDDVYIGSGASIEAEQSVRIGARCRICAFAKIIDTHYHQLEGNRHERAAVEFVVVEDDVEIGPRSVLLPRAHVGHGSMLRAGTVITRRFPPERILAGAPAAVCGKTRAART